jgi:hypothetical protein
MREHADHHDAELLLRLYDLRREARLREARNWIVSGFAAASAEEYRQKYPVGSNENDFFRMAVAYWDMAASVVNSGLIKEEFFFENTAEFWTTWYRTKPLILELRGILKNPYYARNLETLAEKYEKWMDQRAPGAMEVHRQRLQAPAGKRS